MASTTFADRPIKKLCLFDVDDTLTPPRQRVSKEMADVLAQLRKKMAIGFLGGSDWSKIADQLEINSGNVADKFDYGFAENGLIAYKMGKELPSQSFIKFVGETEYKKLVNFILHYLADIDVPIK
ncbi:Phosphomannomutase, partial [Tulasnella sp. 424]